MTREGTLFLSFGVSEVSSFGVCGVRCGSNCVFVQVLNSTPFMKKNSFFKAVTGEVILPTFTFSSVLSLVPGLPVPICWNQNLHSGLQHHEVWRREWPLRRLPSGGRVDAWGPSHLLYGAWQALCVSLRAEAFWSLRVRRAYWHRLPNSFCSRCVSESRVADSQNISLSHRYWRLRVSCDLQPLTLLLWLTEDSDDGSQTLAMEFF